jgi:hypothetical protein
MAPLIIERDAWAGPSRPPGGTFDPLAKTKAFLHHTVQPNKAWTRAQEEAAMRALYDFHVGTNAWKDIGYHLIQFPSSRIYRARPLNRIPAAQGDGDNSGSAVIAIVGTNPILSLFQRRKLRRVIAAWKERDLMQLGGHRDVAATECPGDRIYGWVKKWRVDFRLTTPV